MNDGTSEIIEAMYCGSCNSGKDLWFYDTVLGRCENIIDVTVAKISGNHYRSVVEIKESE